MGSEAPDASAWQEQCDGFSIQMEAGRLHTSGYGWVEQPQLSTGAPCHVRWAAVEYKTSDARLQIRKPAQAAAGCQQTAEVHPATWACKHIAACWRAGCTKHPYRLSWSSSRIVCSKTQQPPLLKTHSTMGLCTCQRTAFQVHLAGARCIAGNCIPHGISLHLKHMSRCL